MAPVEKLVQKTIERPSRHGTARTYGVVGVGGETFLRIDTCGTPGRQMPDKVSQSLQFGPEARRELGRILAALP